MKKDQKIPQTGEMDKQLLARSEIKRIKETEDAEERLQIIQSIARIEDPWAVSVLLVALEDTNEGIRRFIIDFMTQKENLDLSPLSNELYRPLYHACCHVIEHDPVNIGRERLLHLFKASGFNLYLILFTV